MTALPYRLLGGPGSPFSLKLRAILRYRHLPHRWIVPSGYLNGAEELKRAAKGLLPVLQYPEGGYVADSTPIVYELERRHPGQRSVIPDAPVTAFLSHLIEDMADELLSAAMFDLRWGGEPDRTFCAARQISGWVSPLPRAEFDTLVARFTERQIANRARTVRTADCSAILERLYADVLAAIERMLEQRTFLFGSRPSLGDFGLFGQLSQCAIDPSASAILRASAPRAFQWTQTMDDASGIDGEWAAPDDLGTAVPALLETIGRIYLPILQANAIAAAAGESSFEVDVDGLRWSGATDRYKVKCLAWLRDELASMPDPARESLAALLERHGCGSALAPGAEPSLPVRPMVPL